MSRCPHFSNHPARNKNSPHSYDASDHTWHIPICASHLPQPFSSPLFAWLLPKPSHSHQDNVAMWTSQKTLINQDSCAQPLWTQPHIDGCPAAQIHSCSKVLLSETTMHVLLSEQLCTWGTGRLRLVLQLGREYMDREVFFASG